MSDVPAGAVSALEAKRGRQLCGFGIVLAFLHAVASSYQLAPGAAAVDVLGCLVASVTLSSVLMIPAVSGGASVASELHWMVVACAATAWACAVVPPNGEDYFISAYVPMSFVATLAVRWAGARSPGRVMPPTGLGMACGVAVVAIAKRLVQSFG